MIRRRRRADGGRAEGDDGEEQDDATVLRLRIVCGVMRFMRLSLSERELPANRKRLLPPFYQRTTE